MNTLGIVILIAVIAIVAVGIYVYSRNRSARLQSKFGPEYRRAVEESGGKYRAEARLEKLEKRVQKLSIHPLAPEAIRRFQNSWSEVQAEFVDDPDAALADADQLLGEVMSARSYPVTDFEERAAEISVDHATVVDHYRKGHAIARKHARGEATTEELRQAMIHYRTLFNELVRATEVPRARSATA